MFEAPILPLPIRFLLQYLVTVPESISCCQRTLLIAVLLEEPRVDQVRLHSGQHGARALVLNSGLTAIRVDPHNAFSFAIVTSDRPLYDNEIFEVVVEEMEGRWSGERLINPRVNEWKPCLYFKYDFPIYSYH